MPILSQNRLSILGQTDCKFCRKPRVNHLTNTSQILSRIDCKFYRDPHPEFSPQNGAQFYPISTANSDPEQVQILSQTDRKFSPNRSPILSKIDCQFSAKATENSLAKRL
jgi:hypothetical protein